MPQLSKQYTLTISVEQFLEACSLTELQEVDLLLNKYIDKKRFSGNSEEFREIPVKTIEMVPDIKEFRVRDKSNGTEGVFLRTEKIKKEIFFIVNNDLNQECKIKLLNALIL